MSLAFFCLSPPSSSLLFLFFLFYICIYGPNMFHQMFFPVGFQTPVSPPLGFLTDEYFIYRDTWVMQYYGKAT